jgi:ElaA protein
MKNTEWICKKFNELTAAEVYDIMKIRSEVFVVEQNCVYLDADDKDLKAYHLFTYISEGIAAYARLLPQRSSYKEPSIGRVLTAALQRKKGIGILLMDEAIKQTLHLYDTKVIKIGAQLYLKDFYKRFGFKQTSEEYNEDGILHIEMTLTK